MTLTSKLLYRRNVIMTDVFTFVSISRHKEVFSDIAQENLHLSKPPRWWQNLKNSMRALSIFWKGRFGGYTRLHNYEVISREDEAFWVRLLVYMRSLLHLWSSLITFVAGYYICGQTLLHFWSIITFMAWKQGITAHASSQNYKILSDVKLITDVNSLKAS